MSTRSWRIGLALVAAVTAVGGGIALAAGLEGDRFPVDWLRGTPFGSHAAPGLILAVAVGGSATLATVAAIARPSLAPEATIVAGVVLVGWILGEILILTADEELASATELVYFGIGLAMVGLGSAARRVEQGPGARHDHIGVSDGPSVPSETLSCTS
jgi:hypothetical protein